MNQGAWDRCSTSAISALAFASGPTCRRLAFLGGAYALLALSPWGAAMSGVAEEKQQAAQRGAAGLTAKQLNDYGLDLFEHGRVDEAVAILNRAVALYPQAVLPHYNRGTVYLSLKKLEEAVADFSEAVRLDPTFALGYMNRSSAFSYLGRLDEALADADEAVRLNPSYADAFFNRAIVRVKKGMLQAAISDYDKTIELNERDVQSFAGRAAVWWKLGERDKAIADYRKALQIDPRNRAALMGLYELHALP